MPTHRDLYRLMVPIWEMLQNELTELYTIHSVLSLKIIEDIERPLRSAIQNDKDYESIKSVCPVCFGKQLCKEIKFLNISARYWDAATCQGF